MKEKVLEKVKGLPELEVVFEKAASIMMPETRQELLDIAVEDHVDGIQEVAYEAGDKGRVVEATVVKAKNGAVVNYEETYMRRRDPNCMLIADDKETDKETYQARYNEDFAPLREETLKWFEGKDLIIMPFMSGDEEIGYPSILVCPRNAGFFAGGLADLQGFIPKSELTDDFELAAVLYVAPPFRHTHFNGDQIVVHNRTEKVHEVFSYNLYPGPSAKKGIYSILLNRGEAENWTTIHASTVKVITPYDNQVVILHEGASGGGKSEMIEEIHRLPDGRVRLGCNQITDDCLDIELSDTCHVRPVTDDMALCHKDLQDESGKLVVKDAEAGWFLRVDHIQEYGTSPMHEQLATNPQEPLIFLNMQGHPDATCLIWEHTMDTPEKRCPNPRVIMPRNFMPGVVKDQVNVDIRSFGVRVPVCTKENPTYGILGFMQVLPPALAWLWRLVAPRGHGNPSIVDTGGMSSEGVGSYWPFCTGKMVTQANLLLEQIMKTPNTRYVLIPNQHVGAYKVGFMAEWIGREYLSRRGSAKFGEDQLLECRYPLLGYSVKRMRVDGKKIPKGMLRTHEQLEVGVEGYDAGAKILDDFFRKELEKFLTDDLHPTGRKIIETFMRGGSVKEYEDLLPM